MLGGGLIGLSCVFVISFVLSCVGLCLLVFLLFGGCCWFVVYLYSLLLVRLWVFVFCVLLLLPVCLVCGVDLLFVGASLLGVGFVSEYFAIYCFGGFFVC